jgi:hypothetical protein
MGACVWKNVTSPLRHVPMLLEALFSSDRGRVWVHPVTLRCCRCSCPNPHPSLHFLCPICRFFLVACRKARWMKCYGCMACFRQHCPVCLGDVISGRGSVTRATGVFAATIFTLTWMSYHYSMQVFRIDVRRGRVALSVHL